MNRFISITLAITCAGAIHAAEWADCYQLENITLPNDAPPEVGGITFDSDGHFYLCLRRGDVFVAKPQADPAAWEWKHFANGFHNGCGLWSPKPGTVVVSQMAELTEASDTDGDGAADSYRSLSRAWGLSGNYHETNGLWPDYQGGYWIAIGTASHNGPTFFHTRGAYSNFGRRGRNFSSVQYRGWVMHYDGKTGKTTPFCSGFRMHNGIYQDPDGNLWCGDNQGDWKATTPLYHLEEGNFYGHPSSLVWDERWPKDKDPLLAYRNDLKAYNKHRTLPAVQIPHAEMCRSAAGLIEFPRDGSFSKEFAGQLILTDNAGKRLNRIMLEKVGGRFQGCVTFFVNDNGLRSGNNRVRFSPDGKSLYVGQTVRGWGAPAEGLQRITWKGAEVFDICKFSLTKDGFQLIFTKDLPVEAQDPETYGFSSYAYQSRWGYGGPQENKKSHQVTAVRKTGPRTVDVNLDGLEAGRVYQLNLPELKAPDGSKLHNRMFCYTANQLR
jgi:glucose/arabinose dehydrogenase